MANAEVTPPCRVLLVDDHQVMRDGLRLLLQREPGLTVVGEAGDGRTALEQVTRLLPDVVVLDVGLPDMNGLDLARQALQQAPALRLVVLSAEVDPHLLDRALAAGASAYVPKADSADELLEALRTVAVGGTYLSPELAALLVPRYKRLLVAETARPETQLSDREREVVRFIAAGRNTKEIAGELNLSVKTIETHRLRLMAKLRLHSVAELTKYALREGLTSL